MKTGGTTARLLVAAALGHFRCPATRAASSRKPSGLAIAGDLVVAERPYMDAPTLPSFQFMRADRIRLQPYIRTFAAA
jgi:hypothetical protein